MAMVTRLSSMIALCVFGASAGCSDAKNSGNSIRDGAAGDEYAVNSCDGKGTPFVLPLTARTPNGEFSVTLTAAEPTQFSLGDNDWTLSVSGANGDPAAGVAFVVNPWMPEHRHGAVKTVVVTDLGDGKYEAKPINANMPGVWDIRIDFPGDGGTPLRAVLSVCASAR